MRFDAYHVPGPLASYVVNVQADFLSHLATRVVIPLRPAPSAADMMKELHPVVTLDGKRFVLVTDQLSTVPQRALNKPIASLAAHRAEITRALDLLLTGF